MILTDDYPVERLRFKNGVKALKYIDKWECLAIYEGSFTKKHHTAYTINLLSDLCIPGDPEWDIPDLKGITGILYVLNPEPKGNISRFVKQ